MSQLTLADYRKLLREFQELQLRVTRLTYIEQQLRLAQDKLDHEVLRYKRLNSYSYKAIKTRKSEEFFRMTAEAIVDILEVEASAVYIRMNGTGEQLFFNEGLRFGNDSGEETFRREIVNLSRMMMRSKATIIPPNRFQLFAELQQYAQGLIFHTIDETMGISLYLVGLVTSKRAPFYERLTERHETIFNLFAQGFISILNTSYQDTIIKGQSEKISETESELRKLSLIAKKTKSGVVVTDKNGLIEWANQSFLKSIGLGHNDVMHKCIGDLLYVDAANMRKIKNALLKFKPLETTICGRSADGGELIFQTEFLPVALETGEMANNIIILKDITAETRFRNEITEANAKLELIISEAKVGIWEWDQAKNRTKWNDVMLEQFDADEYPDKDYFELYTSRLHPDDREMVLSNRQRVIEGKTDSLKHQYRIYNREGQIRHMQTHMIAKKNKKGKFVGLMGRTVDITDLIRDGEALAARRRFFRSVLNHLSDWVAVVDDDCRLVFLNNAMRALDPDLERMINRHLVDIGDAETKAAHLMTLSIPHVEAARLSREPVFFNGKSEWGEWRATASPSTNEDGNTYTILIFAAQ